jgi:ATP-dependent Clp protease ATP-binding subunit ClpB
VLLDEIEKAHPDVWNILLQVLDDGRLTDSQGRTVDFRNTVLIMTTNVGSQYLTELTDENRLSVERSVEAELRRTFRPEFLNRIDETVFFNPLGRAQMGRIVEIQLERVKKLLADRGIDLTVTPEAVALLAERGFDPVFGARPVKRALQKFLVDPLANEILVGHFSSGDQVLVDVADGELRFRRRGNSEAAA